MPVTLLSDVQIPDEAIGEHFGHHDRYRQRFPGRIWEFRRLRVPLHELYCLYDDPGVRPDNQAGLMGSIGLPPTGYLGLPISALAAAIRDAVTAGTADLANPALSKVLRFRDGGFGFINSLPEPMAVSADDARWFVREGTKRSVALVLIGASHLDAIDFESGR